MNLLNHQQQAIAHLQEWKIGALFMEAGTGKTRVACELINAIEEVDVVIWIAPLRTIKPLGNNPSIVTEIEKWSNRSSIFNYYGIESIQSSDRIYLELLSLITTAKCPFVVVDESLKIKNADAKRTKRLLEIGQYAKYKLILNGTPLSKNLLDLWSQMEFLSPKILNMTLVQFKNTFCCYTKVTKSFGYRSYSKEFITGYENIDYLHSLIKHYVYECDLHLNISQMYHNIDYNIDDGSREEYNALKELFLSDETLEWKNNNIFLEMTQKMQHAYCVTEDKFTQLNKLFDSIPQEKTIIFCKYIKSREECERRYPNAKVLSYQRESLGLNLQDYSYTVYFDKMWDYALRIQAGRRTYRVGQEVNCQYYDLTGNINLERLIDKNIDKKIDMSEYFKRKTKEELKKEL